MRKSLLRRGAVPFGERVTVRESATERVLLASPARTLVLRAEVLACWSFSQRPTLSNTLPSVTGGAPAEAASDEAAAATRPRANGAILNSKGRWAAAAALRTGFAAAADAEPCKEAERRAIRLMAKNVQGRLNDSESQNLPSLPPG